MIFSTPALISKKYKLALKTVSLYFKSENKLLLRFDFLKRVAHVKVKNVFQIDLGIIYA